ncbi:MAG: hypothetical protein Q4G63_06455 [Bacteroidia bacterium]|nr:hypothetical protein [Bacteroidia bacterium]
MEKKNEYIDKLLQNLQNLEAKVSTIKQDEAVPFSFLREAFQKAQEVMNLLHELEMLQIEDMKQQMEKLVLFLSETEVQKPVEEIKPFEYEEENIESAVVETEEIIDFEEQTTSEETEKIIQEEKIARRNIYAEGITLPTYINPRNIESNKEEVFEDTETSVADQIESAEEKPVIRSVNDIIQAPPSKLDIKRSLSLNDRFYYQRELFNNDREAMNSMMIRLNAFDNYEDTEQYLKEKTSWDFKDERVQSFLELLKKGFD